MEFVPSISVFLSFTVAGIVLAITPGPDMSLILSRSINAGRKAGFFTLFGTAFGVVVHTMLAAFGISILIKASETGFLALKIVGACYLAWLAFDALRNGSALNLNSAATKPRSFAREFSTGMGINLLNPKVVLFFVTFLPQFVSSSDPNVRGKLIFLGLYFLVISIPLVAAMILAVDKIAESLKRNPKVMRAIDYVFAGIFGAFAVRILLIRP